MRSEKFIVSKAFMCCWNIIFLMSGFALMSLGGLLLADSDRILLSRLLGPADDHPHQPLFYYLAFFIVGVGFTITITGFLGCWAFCVFNRCITTLYVITILILLLGECALCILVVFWPHLLGCDIRPTRLIRALQRSYTVPGHDQFTAAIDLVQTAFSCCGINGSNNYGTSWWRLQEVGRRELVVPLTCCLLNNAAEADSFLNPEPYNLTACQALNPAIHQQARHTIGCLETIEKWTQEQALILLAIGLTVMLVEISAIVSTLVACTKINLHKKSQISNFTSTQTLNPFNENDHDYEGSAVKRNEKTEVEPRVVSEENAVKVTNERSVIENWCNPSETKSKVIRSDELYEERAVDVGFEELQKIPKSNNSKRATKLKTDIMKMTNIPIKDYRASIARNIGTLRRSLPPQNQFESLVSEPEKIKKASSGFTKVISCQLKSHKKQQSEKDKILIHRVLDPSLGSLEGHRSLKIYGKVSGSSSSIRLLRHRRRSMKNKKMEKNDLEGNSESSDEKKQSFRGHVVQKISAYEENARRSAMGDAFLSKNSTGQRKHRTIGVPLVGMHNACGLPVVAWPDRKYSKYHSRRQSRRETVDHRACVGKIDKSKIIERMSMRKKKINTLPNVKSLGFQMKKNQESSDLNSLKRRSIKRRTLYATNEGNDAVRVLTSLCLNPLARNRSGAYMLW